LQKSDNEQSGVKEGRWTKDEHERFIEALRQYGKDWAKIEEVVGTRNSG